jgi:hypothetical protein
VPKIEISSVSHTGEERQEKPIEENIDNLIPSLEAFTHSGSMNTEQSAILEHYQSKGHLKKREELQIKEQEDLTMSMLVLCSCPGDIEEELKLEKEKALKRLVRRLKSQYNQ